MLSCTLSSGRVPSCISHTRVHLSLYTIAAEGAPRPDIVIMQISLVMLLPLFCSSARYYNRIVNCSIVCPFVCHFISSRGTHFHSLSWLQNTQWRNYLNYLCKGTTVLSFQRIPSFHMLIHLSSRTSLKTSLTVWAIPYWYGSLYAHI